MSAEEKTVSRLVSELLAGAVRVDAGSFTLDTQAAAAKMERFKYRDRGRYLVLMVEALFRLGATEIRVVSEGADLEIQAPGVSIGDPLRGLGNIYGWAVGETETSQDRALARLAVAIDMALGWSTVESVTVSLPSTEGRTVALFRAGEEPELRTAESTAEQRVPKVVVDRSWKDNLDFKPNAYPLAQLDAAVRYSEKLVMEDQWEVSRFDRALENAVTKRGEGFQVLVGFDPERPRFANVELWSGGVHVDTREGAARGYRAVVHLDDPRYDMAQAQVLADPILDAALEAVDQALADCLATRGEEAEPVEEEEVAVVELGEGADPEDDAPTVVAPIRRDDAQGGLVATADISVERAITPKHTALAIGGLFLMASSAGSAGSAGPLLSAGFFLVIVSFLWASFRDDRQTRALEQSLENLAWIRPPDEDS